MNPEDKGKLAVIRGLVRPIVTYLVVGTLIAVVLYLVFHFGDQDAVDRVLEAFLILVTAITAFWFASRNQPKPPTPPTSGTG